MHKSYNNFEKQTYLIIIRYKLKFVAKMFLLHFFNFEILLFTYALCYSVVDLNNIFFSIF